MCFYKSEDIKIRETSQSAMQIRKKRIVSLRTASLCSIILYYNVIPTCYQEINVLKYRINNMTEQMKKRKENDRFTDAQRADR